MHTKEWYYCIPGAEVHGPLPIETIRAAVTAGMLSELVHLGCGSSGPWAPIEMVEKLGDAAFAPGAKLKLRKAKKAAQSASGDWSVAGYVRAGGVLMLAAGGLCLAAAALAWIQGTSGPAMCAYCGLAAIAAGLVLLAAAEVLRRLAEISEELKKHRHHD